MSGESLRHAIAYIPVLHAGYHRFLLEHAAGAQLWLIGPALVPDDRALAKDIRALDPTLIARAIDALGICASVAVLAERDAASLAAAGTALVLPDEDVSHRLVAQFFPRNDVRYASAFLRWDRTRTARLIAPRATRSLAGLDALVAELVAAGDRAAAGSIDFWRQVGAALRLADGQILTAVNEHLPQRQSPYVVGDPRTAFFRGVALELTTAEHAEARLIGECAARGLSCTGASLYVTDFPCPPCSKLIARSGILRLYYRDGYAVTDGEDVLVAAGIEIVRIGG